MPASIHIGQHEPHNARKQYIKHLVVFILICILTNVNRVGVFCWKRPSPWARVKRVRTWEPFPSPFAGASEDRPPRVLSPISPPVLASCAWSGGPIGATRGGKPSAAERGPENCSHG